MRVRGSTFIQVVNVCLWIVVCTLTQAALWADVPASLKVFVVGVAALSLWRPAIGLLIVAGLMPLGHAVVTRVWHAYRFDLTEAIVLAFLAGYTWPWRQGRPDAPPAIRRAVVLFATVILATCLTQLTIERTWQDHWGPFLRGFADYLTTDYFTAQLDIRPSVRGPAFMGPAMLWIEGAALLLAARSLGRSHPGLAMQALALTTMAGLGAATLTFVRVAVVGAEQQLGWIDSALSPMRFTAAIPSIVASGSYFALVGWVAWGLAAARHGLPRVGWGMTGVVLFAAGWLTKSRGPIVAWFVAAAALAAWWMLQRVAPRRRFLAFASAVAIAATVGVTLIVANPGGVLRPDADDSLRLRGLLLRGSLHMIAAYPAFGVGLQQFKLRYHEFRPADPEFPTYIEDDPHNELLGIATELGLVGLATFLAIVAAALFEILRGLRHGAATRPLLGVAAGLVSFALTWLSHQSMTVPAPALTFWLVLGLAVALAAPAPLAAAPAPPLAPWRRLGPRVAVALAMAAVLASVPFRARAEIDQIDMTRVHYGLHEWETDGAGVRFRWTTGHATLFLPASMSVITLPVSASLPAAESTDVRILVDGEHAGHLQLTDEAWHDVRLTAPRNATRPWRIDLIVSPTYVPRAIGRNPDDARELGVRLGEVVER